MASPPNPLIESIETHLLGRVGLSFDRWASRTGWSRDHADNYCWRCGGSVGPHETDGEGCAGCRKKPVPWDRAIRLSRYHGVVRDEILALKFHAWRPTGVGLGKHLGWAIRERREQAGIEPDQAMVVPIPTHRFRRMARGVDHTLVLARAAGGELGCPVRRVLRARHRPEQVGLSATARAANIRGAFVVQEKLLKRALGGNGQPVRLWILIDDVRTTGATFAAASRALRKGLRKAGDGGKSQIWACCVGVAGEKRRLLDPEMDREAGDGYNPG
ncbi:MAG: hypothetical protein WD114_06500 [Phycisphaerales bacterium]